MGVGTTIGVIGGTLGAAGIGALGASSAAGAQSSAAKSAAQLQYQSAEDALNFQKQQYATSQKELAPWLQAGTGAIGTLSSLTSTPGEGLLAPFGQSWSAPTAAEAAATPGYQFTLQQGQNAIQNSAAAQGGLLSTGAEKTLAGYTTGLADQTYNDVYNRSLQDYMTNFNVYQTNQTNTFNRLAALSGIGQTAANTLTGAGQSAAGNVANIYGNMGAQVGNSMINAGAAQASGYAGIANAANSGISSITQGLLLSSLLNPSQPFGTGIIPGSTNLTG